MSGIVMLQKPVHKMLLTSLHVVLILFFTRDYVVESSVDFDNNRDVVTDRGSVRGHYVENGNYYAFLGIPYAEPPIGQLRFKAPVPPNPWNTTFIANRKIVCPQSGIGEEDCLVVNIFVPAEKANEKIPVLVYIHGGSFLHGSGPTEGMDPLIRQGVIVVTINYRLGPLGFLCLGNDEAPGNAGLKDQVAVLKWVKENIDNFDGDPDNVTLYGTDTGAACVEFHVLSKLNRNLFQKVIIESGSSCAVRSIDMHPLSTAKNLARAFTVSGFENPQKLLEIYQNVPADLLSRVNEQYFNSLTGGTVGFAPCIERKGDKNYSIISRFPDDILRKGQYHKLPMVFIFASFEGLFLRSNEYYALNYKNRMEGNFEQFLPIDLNFDSDSQKYEAAKVVKRFYFGNKTIDDDNIVQYLNYFGDSLILRPLLNSAEMHARRGSTVYLMEFAEKGNMGDYDEFYKSISKSGHGDFNSYVILKKPIKTRSDQLAIDRAAMLVANFVKYGNPTPNRSDTLPILWPQVHPPNSEYLLFKSDLEILNAPYKKIKEFWNQLYYDLNKNKKRSELDSDICPC